MMAAQYPSTIQMMAGNPMTSGTPVIMEVRPSNPVSLNPNQAKTLKVLSVLQIIFGVVAMINQVALIIMRNLGFEVISSGLWCGAMFLAAGIIGVVGASRSSKGLVIATMVMSIISSVFLWVIVALTSLSTDYCEYSGYYYYYYGCSSGYLASNSILLVAGLAEFVVSIWTSVLCCKGACEGCGNRTITYNSQPPYFGAQTSGGNQLFIMPNSGLTAAQPHLIYPRQIYHSQVLAPAGVPSGFAPMQIGVPVNQNMLPTDGGPPPYFTQGISSNRTS